MHSTHRYLIVVSVVAAGVVCAGCYDTFSEPSLFRQEPGDVVGVGCTGGAAGSSTSATADPACTPQESPAPVRDDCGVFVSSSKGSDDNDGSQAKPFASIAKALAAASGKPIYLCAETFPESLRVKAGQTVYGGLDCSNGWTYAGEDVKSEIAPPAGEFALRVEPSVAVTMEDVILRAKAAMEPAGSSVAVIAARGTALTLSRCDVVAGTGGVR
jgi:hypothetical protein